MSNISIGSAKPRLSFWQIWNMSFGCLGIQFGFALQNANTSRIFETLGAQVDQLAVYWLAAPVTGLVVQPIDVGVRREVCGDRGEVPVGAPGGPQMVEP